MTDTTEFGAYTPEDSRDPPLSSLDLRMERLDLVANWRRCGSTADYVGGYLAELFADPALASLALSTVINELVENAVKYSLPGRQPLRLVAAFHGTALLVQTEHPCTVGQAARLQQTVEQMGERDPEQLFLMQLEHTAAHDVEASGLGLLTLAKDYAARVGGRATPSPTPDVVWVSLQVWIHPDAIEAPPRTRGSTPTAG